MSRLLLVTTSLAHGGAERQVVDIAKEFRRRGWDVRVLSMLAPTAHTEELAEAGVRVDTLDMRKGRPSAGAFARYLRSVRSWRPTVVHAHMVHANLLARLAKPFARGVPVVCTVHSVVEGSRWREIAYRLTDPLADTTTAVSQAAADRYERVGAVPRGRIRMVANGVEIHRRPVVPREVTRSSCGVGDDFVWINVARLEEVKGHDVLLEAMARVVRVRPETRLWLVGDGTLRTRLEHQAAELGLADHVSFIGLSTDVTSYLAGADAFVMSSRWEGLPMALLEAAAQRLPIVSTDVGGCREVARPEDGAILTDEGAGALADGMVSMMALDAASRATVGENLAAHVSRTFDMRVVGDTWETIYIAASTGRQARATKHA